MTLIPSFDDYLANLSAVSPTATAGADPATLGACATATQALLAARPLDTEKLASLLNDQPRELPPVLAAAAGLSQERFKGWLKQHLGTAGWVNVARSDPHALAQAFDQELDIVNTLETQASREWTWADILARTMAPSQRAGDSVRQGRALEDAVEGIVTNLGLPFVARTRFEGTNGQTAPADFAIPGGGSDALIAVAVKGYDSTGSKLTDAATEIETMANVRQPRQFIFAVVDGLGWHRRASDLRRIYGLWAANRIDGVYNVQSLPKFESVLADAAHRVRLL